ncbi:hypothetical protein SALBM311S_06349 [Streptomyces alboniger]
MTRTFAAVLEAPGAAFTLQEIQLDEPHPNEVLVRMVAAGLCHTDLLSRQATSRSPFPVCSVTRVPEWSNASAAM